jgi:hypothetical protein
MGFSNIPAENKKQKILPKDLGFIDWAQLQSARMPIRSNENMNLPLCSTKLNPQSEALGGPDIRLGNRTSFKSKVLRKNESQPNFKVSVTGNTPFSSKGAIGEMQESFDTEPSPVKKVFYAICGPIGKGQILSEKTTFNRLRSSKSSFMVPQ